ncbi:Pyruvate decarboxylase [Caenispirillum salinarum AK4]|uniref:Pyruvate decarboxylase n=1 Tax=Caenispirillum salinarum AK4 TaxID=1238182 RepID=K9HCE2_9PROT|nr:indolepyruvate/phenylpyruvate decarboxylase [Caenispirillum salinarum]EKV26446.1 Pyruvate decarboxylase [Caenispirillum salinarum AK4]
MASISEVLLSALKDHGAREIFGIPGDFALPFFRYIESTGILPLYCLSHEPGVGFAADAAARIHKGIGVACVTYGAGALNMVNPVAGAYSEKTPLVVISGAPGKGEKGRGLLLHHQAKTIESQFKVYQEITCAQAVLDDARTAPREIARVLRACIDESRPVYIEIPRDMVAEPCEPVEPLPRRRAEPDAVAACAAEILEKLKTASAPALLIGVEVRRHDIEDEVARLARRLNIPVATTFMGRGLLAGTDAPLVGVYMGLAGKPDVRDIIEDADALLALGVILSDTNFGVSGRNIDLRRAVIAADGEVGLGYHKYPGIPLADLVEELLRQAEEPGAAAAARKPSPQICPEGLEADDTPVGPMDIARAVNDLFKAHGPMPIAADMGDCLFTAMDMHNTALVAPGYYATMGFGVPAGLGVAAATGERPLILVGDGAFQMTGWELGNCNANGWAPIVIVFNNASWEMLRTFQPEGSYNNLAEWRFADLAQALNGRGHRATTRAELKKALDAAVADAERFHLIEVMLERGAISDTLSRFVATIKGSNAPPRTE